MDKESDGTLEEGKKQNSFNDRDDSTSDDSENETPEGIYYDAISAVTHHGNKSEWKEANVTLIGNNYSPKFGKYSYENVTELDKYSTARTVPYSEFVKTLTEEEKNEGAPNLIINENDTEIKDIQGCVDPRLLLDLKDRENTTKDTQDSVDPQLSSNLKDSENGIKTEEKQLSSYLPDHGIAEVTKEKEDNSRPVSVKEISQRFELEDENTQNPSSLYCLAKPLDHTGSDQYYLAQQVDEDEDDDYVKAIKVDTSLIPKPVTRQIYQYDPPWNDEFPSVMVIKTKIQDEIYTTEGQGQTSINQDKDCTTEGQGQASIKGQGQASIKPDEKEDELYVEVPIESSFNSNFEASGKYNHLFEGSVSVEPKTSNMYGEYSPSQNEKSDKGNKEIKDTQFVPALPILISSGVYSNAYESNITNSMNSTGNDNVYEEVKSQISEDPGWNTSEFDSDSSTDYENSPDPDIIDKPLPPTPKEMGRSPAENSKKKEENSKTRAKNSQILPVKVNLKKHPPPHLPPAPEGLENHQVKRRYGIQSLIDTEKIYIHTLQRLAEEYKEPLLVTHGLQGTPIDVILTKGEQILDIHKMFQIELADKVENWDRDEQIGNIFTGFFSRKMVIDLYSCYVNNFSVAMEELKTLQSTKAALAAFLTDKASNSSDRLSLFGLLVKPVQRFPQFITMMQDLLKYTPHQHHDRSSLQTALTDLENVAHKLNESKRLTEQKLQAKRFMKELSIKSIKVDKLLRQDDLDQICETGNSRTKSRRLFLTDSTLICTTVTHREQDSKGGDRIKFKWAISLNDLELKDNAISPDLSCSVRANGGLLSIHTRKESFYQDSDPLNLQNDLENMIHDYTVLGKVSSLVGTLKCSYQNLPEELFDEIISDIQRKVQVKNQQLQILNSCTVVVEQTNAPSNRKERHTFQTILPELKQEWSTDFLIAKLSLDPINNPSWTSLRDDEDATKQPALFMKHLPVDMPRYFTKMKCAVPVYLASHGSSDIGIQHLWVVMTTPLRTQVALVSVQNTRPSLVESFQASSSEVIAVETVPGFATTDSNDSFTEDTVWMSTVKKEVLIFSVFDEQGLRDQTKLNRVPKKIFHCHGKGQQIHYTIERVFIGTDEGILVIYDRNQDGMWNFDSPSIVQLASSSINSIISLDEEVWVACGQDTYIIPVEESYYLEQIEMSCKEGGDISNMVRSGVGLWIAHHGSSSIHLYHIETKKHLQEINIKQSVDNLVQSNTDLSLGQETSCVITSLMTSKGFLWVGTCSGVLLTFPLPRLKDGVPIISGRPFVSYHGHNGPIQFLIPIYCGTVNLWHKAKGLDYNTIDIRGQNAVESEHSQGKKIKANDKKRHSTSDLEQNALSHISLEGDYVKMLQKPIPPEKPVLTYPGKIPGGRELDKKNRLSRSADDITQLLPSKFPSKNDQRGKTLKFSTKLASRSNATKTLGHTIGAGEDDVNEVYKDLMRNESMTKQNIQTKPSNRKPSFRDRIVNRLRETTSSVRVSTDEPKLRALDTLSKRGCNSVMIVMGGDGYIDWNKKSSASMKNLEAALIIWLYKC